MSEFIVTRVTDNPDDIQHYGVLGMKWGVRHDPAKAYSKASAKREKLEKKVTSTRDNYLKKSEKANSGVSLKYQKKQAKASRLQAKADKKKYGLFTNANKAAKLQVKADRAQYKANKYKARYEKRNANKAQAEHEYAKAQRKAERWINQMDKTFDGYSMSELSQKNIDAGAKFVKKYA